MKKIFALILSCIMILTLVSCGGGNTKGHGSNDGFDDETDYDDIVEEVNMYYGDDETEITLYKPDVASFAIGADEAENAGDIVVLVADDYSWDAEIMGYKYYEGIGSNRPFVDSYFVGDVVSDEYTDYDEEMYYLDLEYDDAPVMLINYLYEKEDSGEEKYETFVGFEYEGFDDCGLFGCIFVTEEDYEDDYFAAVFAQLLNLDYDYEFETAEADDWDDWDDEEEYLDTDLIVGEWENVDNPDEVYFFFADDYATYTVDEEETELTYSIDEDGNLTLEFEDGIEEYIVSFDGSDTMYFSDGAGHSIELGRI